MPSSDPDTRSLAARIAAHASWANTGDPSQRTSPARAAFLRRFVDEVDPRRELDPDERSRRADHARRAYFLRLALKSADSRRRKSEAAQLRSLADQLDAAGDRDE